MTTVAILVPVLDRPARVQFLVASLAASARFIDLIPYFLCSPGDEAEIAAVRAAGLDPVIVPDKAGAGNYALKINHGFRLAAPSCEFLFLAADDLIFHPGWIERALACHLETHACVIGTSDLGNATTTSGQHSTHTLVHRDYGECGTIDESDSGKLLCELYDHNEVDVEFVETAKARETWAHATDSIVEHLHPLWSKGTMDGTYRKGQQKIREDHALCLARRPLWDSVR